MRAMVASLLASDPEKSDPFGRELIAQIFEIFNRQREEGVQPVQKEDVAEVCARSGGVKVSANEWAKACNLRDRYWLYVVFSCATPQPRFVRVRDPFGRLLARAKGSVLIQAGQIISAAEEAQ
jgi:hypothetical protein